MSSRGEPLFDAGSALPARILAALRAGPTTVQQLVERTGRKRSTISAALADLRKSGAVERTQERGEWRLKPKG